MILLAAIDRGDVADYVDTLVLVYVVLIFVQIIVSFIPRMPYNRFLSAFLTFVADVVNPYLNIFRRFLPPVRIGPGALDLSPMVGTFVLLIVGGIVSGLIRGGEPGRRLGARRGHRRRCGGAGPGHQGAGGGEASSAGTR